MTGYTSGKTTRDPKPWLSTATSPDLRASEYLDDDWAFRPRPEYDNHNPILVGYRANPDIDLWDIGFAMFTSFGGNRDWDERGHYFHSFTIATPEQVDHARRVLTRVAAL